MGQGRFVDGPRVLMRGWTAGLGSSVGVADNSGGTGPGEEPAVWFGLPVEGSDGFSGGVLAVCLPSF